MVTPGADDRAAAEPDVVGERDRLSVLPALAAGFRVDRVRGGQQLHPRRDLTCGSDRDRSDVEHHRIEVDEGTVPDADRAELAAERRPYDDALANVPKHPAEQCVALVEGAGRCVVEPGKELLHAQELGFVLRVVGDVELAAQHPVPHLAHPRLIPRRGARALAEVALDQEAQLAAPGR